MKLKIGRATRAVPRSSRLLACAALLGGAACVADNRLGVDDGTGGKGGPYPVMAYALSGDPITGQLAIATGSLAGPVTILDVQDGAPLRVLKPATQTAPNVVVSQANGIVALADVNVVWLFRSDGTLLRGISHDAAGVSALTMSVDGTLLVTGDTDWTVHLFDVASGAELMPPFAVLTPPEGRGAWIVSLVITPDNAHIAAGGSMGVHVWRVGDGALLAAVPGPTNNVALSAAGELAVSHDADVTFYSLTGDQLGRYPLTGAAPYYLAYSRDGTKLAIAINPVTDLKRVTIIDRPAGTESATLIDELQVPAFPSGKINILTGIAFLEDDTAVAVGWSDRSVTLFGSTDGAVIWRRVLGE